ncbi:MAG: hypothetical protein LBC07_04655, partial [Elusimicrobiota bacterium]|nr:hypothetical protein [Elusimicrobiota bacterium]
ANNGGAVFADASTFSFDKSSGTFIFNVSTSSGGAVFLNGSSKFSFTNSLVYFTFNTANKAGGAVFLDSASQASFINSSGYFAYNNAAKGGGAIYLSVNSTIAFLNFSGRFENNSAQSAGGAIFIDNCSTISFKGSTVSFISNSAQPYDFSGGAIAVNDYSNFSVINSSLTFISNTAGGYFSGSAILIGLYSNISFENSSIDFIDNSASDGGALTVSASGLVSFVNSKVNFTNNISASADVGSIFMDYYTTTTFENSQITFKNNTAGGILRDIYFLGYSALIFSGDNFLPNGIRTAGNANVQVLKQKAGTLIFAGDPSIILHTFIVEAGTVIFKTKVSTSAALNVKNGSSFILNNDVEVSSFYITGAFTLQGNLQINIDFTNKTTDWIYVGGTFNVSKSTLSTSAAVKQFDGLIKILTSKSALPQPLDLTPPDKLVLRKNQDNTNSIFLAYIFWNEYVAQWQNQNAPSLIEFKNDIFASEEKQALAFNSPASTNFTIDAQGHLFDSSGLKGLGFALNNSSNTFKNISLKNFANANANGAALSVQKSNLTFTGGINFITASADINGGAVYASNNSNISFIGSSATFLQNSAANGGAIYLDNSSISFINSSAAFLGNSAVNYGGAIYLAAASTMVFSNSQITFSNNKADGIANDIYFAANSAALIFRGDNFLPNGLRSQGASEAGIVQKQDEGTLIFGGAASIILNTFELQAGSAIFKSAVSTIAVLNVSNGAFLSLSNPAQINPAIAVSSLYITGNFNLEGILKINVDFDNFMADWIYVGGTFTTAHSSISLNLVGEFSAPIKILTSKNQLPQTLDLTVLEGFGLKVEGDSIFLAEPPASFWNNFVRQWQSAGGKNVQLGTVTLAADDYAPHAIGAPQSANLSVDGQGYFLDSGGFKDLGFAIVEASAAFKNISFYSFIAQQSSGAVFTTYNSALTFTST